MKERNIGIELLRVILSFAVVSGHFGDPFHDKGLHVPIFMLIAFYCSADIIISQERNKLVKRLYRLFIPYFFWGGDDVVIPCFFIG